MKDIILKELNRRWIKSSTRKMTYQKIHLYHDGLVNCSKGIFGINRHYCLWRVNNESIVLYYDLAEADKQASVLIDKFSNKQFILEKIAFLGDQIKKDFNDHLKYLKSLPQDWSGHSKQELIKNLNNFYFKEARNAVYYELLFNNIEIGLTEGIKILLSNNNLETAEIDKILSILQEQTLIIPLDLERLSILRIALLESKYHSTELEKHWQNFACLPMYDINYEPYPKKYFEKELKVLLKKLNHEHIKNEIVAINFKYKKRLLRANKLLDKFKNKKEIYYLMKFYNDFASLKDQKPLVRDSSSFYIKNLFFEIAKRLQISLTQVLFLTKEELNESLKTSLVVSKKELDKRCQNSVFLTKDNKTIFSTNKKYLKSIDKILKADNNTKEIKGVAISPGVVRGRLSIILSNSDFNKFKTGQILVASATRPDYINLMKRSVAIITDEGGLLSHAAIVSRELKKPCIVGLKRITQILKDGDLVEVDANKGVVRIIK